MLDGTFSENAKECCYNCYFGTKSFQKYLKKKGNQAASIKKIHRIQVDVLTSFIENISITTALQFNSEHLQQKSNKNASTKGETNKTENVFGNN